MFNNINKTKRIIFKKRTSKTFLPWMWFLGKFLPPKWWIQSEINLFKSILIPVRERVKKIIAVFSKCIWALNVPISVVRELNASLIVIWAIYVIKVRVFITVHVYWYKFQICNKIGKLEKKNEWPKHFLGYTKSRSSVIGRSPPACYNIQKSDQRWI